MIKVITGSRDKFTDVTYSAEPNYNGECIEELTKVGFLKKEAKTKSKETE